jgi:Zn-finger nucleic acid-binding protein
MPLLLCPNCGVGMKEVERHYEEELEAYHRKEGKPYKKKKGFLELFDLVD